MLKDGQEFACRTIDISLGGVGLRTLANAAAGDKIVAYLDHFGRVEGTVMRALPQVLALKLTVPPARRRRWAELLMWVGNRHDIGAKEDRRHRRIVPRTDRTVLEYLNRTRSPAQILEMSESGARIAVDPRPPVGARVVVGRTTANVIRHCDDGVAVEFLRVIPQHVFDETFVL